MGKLKRKNFRFRLKHPEHRILFWIAVGILFVSGVLQIKNPFVPEDSAFAAVPQKFLQVTPCPPSGPCVLGTGTTVSDPWQDIAGDTHITGNVGIGTTAPFGRLNIHSDVNGTSRTTQLYIDSATNSNQKLYIGINGNSGATTGDYASMEYLQEGQHWGPLALQGDGGYVGIGKTNPSQKLDITNGAVVLSTGYGYMYHTGSGDWTGLYSDGSPNLYLVPWAGQYTSTVVGPNSAVNLVVPNGNLGVGTWSPGSKLQVVGSGGLTADFSVNGRIVTGDGNNDGGMWLDNTGGGYTNYGDIFIGQNRNTDPGQNDIGLWTNGAGWSLSVAQNGDVKIGSSGQSRKLCLNGNCTTSLGGGSVYSPPGELIEAAAIWNPNQCDQSASFNIPQRFPNQIDYAGTFESWVSQNSPSNPNVTIDTANNNSSVQKVNVWSGVGGCNGSQGHNFPIILFGH